MVAVYVALAAVAATMLEGAPLAPAEKWLFGIATVVAVPGVISAILVFMPRTEAPYASLVFFGEISKLSSGEDFHGRLLATTEEDCIADLAYQVYVNASIATGKHAAVRASALFGALTLLVWLVAIAVSATYPVEPQR